MKRGCVPGTKKITHVCWQLLPLCLLRLLQSSIGLVRYRTTLHVLHNYYKDPVRTESTNAYADLTTPETPVPVATTRIALA